MLHQISLNISYKRSESITFRIYDEDKLACHGRKTEIQYINLVLLTVGIRYMTVHEKSEQ